MGRWECSKLLDTIFFQHECRCSQLNFTMKYHTNFFQAQICGIYQEVNKIRHLDADNTEKHKTYVEGGRAGGWICNFPRSKRRLKVVLRPQCCFNMTVTHDRRKTPLYFVVSWPMTLIGRRPIQVCIRGNLISLPLLTKNNLVPASRLRERAPYLHSTEPPPRTQYSTHTCVELIFVNRKPISYYA